MRVALAFALGVLVAGCTAPRSEVPAPSVAPMTVYYADEPVLYDGHSGPCAADVESRNCDLVVGTVAVFGPYEDDTALVALSVTWTPASELSQVMRLDVRCDVENYPGPVCPGFDANTVYVQGSSPLHFETHETLGLARIRITVSEPPQHEGVTVGARQPYHVEGLIRHVVDRDAAHAG